MVSASGVKSDVWGSGSGVRRLQQEMGKPLLSHGLAQAPQQGLGGFLTREGASVSETVPLDCRAASGLSLAGWRGEDGSLRSKMREPPAHLPGLDALYAMLRSTPLSRPRSRLPQGIFGFQCGSRSMPRPSDPRTARRSNRLMCSRRYPPNITYTAPAAAPP
jgi:hypothetical protein